MPSSLVTFRPEVAKQITALAESGTQGLEHLAEARRDAARDAGHAPPRGVRGETATGLAGVLPGGEASPWELGVRSTPIRKMLRLRPLKEHIQSSICRPPFVFLSARLFHCRIGVSQDVESCLGLVPRMSTSTLLLPTVANKNTRRGPRCGAAPRRRERHRQAARDLRLCQALGAGKDCVVRGRGVIGPMSRCGGLFGFYFSMSSRVTGWVSKGFF